MKNIMLIAAGIMLFCIASIVTTHAMPCRAPGENSPALNPPDAVLPVFNQRELPDIAAELHSPFSGSSKALQGERLARNGREVAEHPDTAINRRPVRREYDDGAVYVDDDDNNENDDSDDTDEDDDNDNGNDGSNAVDNVNSNNNGNNGGEDDNYYVDDKEEIL